MAVAQWSEVHPLLVSASQEVPPVEVFERDHRLTVRVELPGIKEEEIGVTFTDGVLTIEGERKFENEEKKNEWYRNERTYGKFVRTVPLPEGVKATDIKATFEGGVLEIAVPLPATAVFSPAPPNNPHRHTPIPHNLSKSCDSPARHTPDALADALHTTPT